MVIERFKQGHPRQISERLRRRGRMLPPGVTYHASWVDSKGTCCYQIVEASDPQLLDPWIASWADLIDFEIVPVKTSADFWRGIPLG